MLQEESSFSDYQLIMELMNDSNFRTLFDRQFDDFSNIKSILVIMKTYAYLEKLYITQYGHTTYNFVLEFILFCVRDLFFRKIYE